MQQMASKWCEADAVCFDVDSTVIQEEGIDELAKFCNKAESIINLTNAAMGGSMTFEDSLKLRLDILQPSLNIMKNFINMNPPRLSPGIKKLVDTLHKKGVPVFLVSGGFRCFIAPIASKLNITEDSIFCNRLKFYFNGDYAGFDETQPTSKSGGKGIVVELLKEKYGFQNLIFIGDGATDLEASPPADAFIGYGGNVIREAVKAKCKWFITDFNELIECLE